MVGKIGPKIHRGQHLGGRLTQNLQGLTAKDQQCRGRRGQLLTRQERASQNRTVFTSQIGVCVGRFSGKQIHTGI